MLGHHQTNREAETAYVSYLIMFLARPDELFLLSASADASIPI